MLRCVLCKYYIITSCLILTIFLWGKYPPRLHFLTHGKNKMLGSGLLDVCWLLSNRNNPRMGQTPKARVDPVDSTVQSFILIAQREPPWAHTGSRGINKKKWFLWGLRDGWWWVKNVYWTCRLSRFGSQKPHWKELTPARHSLTSTYALCYVCACFHTLITIIRLYLVRAMGFTNIQSCSLGLERWLSG